MADYFTVCDCGHKRRVTEKAIGLFGRCPACGAEVVVTEDTLVPVDQADQPAAPHAEEEEIDFSVDPDAPARDDSLVMGFLDEEEEAPPPPGEPEPAPPEQEDTGAEDYEDMVIQMRSAAQPAVSRDGCTRCGRAFRGDWDRYHTPQGVLCHICANLPAEAPPQDTMDETAGLTPAEQVRQAMPDDGPPPAVSRPEEEEVAQTFFDEHRELIRAIVLSAGVGVLLLAIVVGLFGDSSPPAESADPAVQAARQNQLAEKLEQTGLGEWMPWILFGTRFVVGYFGELAVLYFTLYWSNALPNDRFVPNLLAVGAVAVGLHIVWSLPIYAFLLVGILLGPLRIVLVLYFLGGFYHLTLGELITYYLAHLLMFVASWAVTTALLGALGMMLM